MLKTIHIICWVALLACSKKSSPPATNVIQGGSTTKVVNVSTAAQLKAALLNAKPNDEIVMADGVYNGKFVVDVMAAGTVTHPIILRGSKNAILDAGSINTGYVLHLQANYWIVKGFSITNGLKGIMADGINYTIIDGVKVYNIGEEGIHLRKFSSNNTIQNTDISNTGLKTPDYGEGIYIGSAKNNWANYSNGNPDVCDSNKVLNNTIGPNISAECIDIKEGTTAGIIRGNTFDAAGITGANSGDSWIDVKGNNYLIENNTGTNPGGSIFKDGFQTHVAVNGWGNNNIFKSNNCTVNAAGYGFSIQLSGSNGTSSGNKVYANNIVNGAASGVSNIPLSN